MIERDIRKATFTKYTLRYVTVIDQIYTSYSWLYHLEFQLLDTLIIIIYIDHLCMFFLYYALMIISKI